MKKVLLVLTAVLMTACNNGKVTLPDLGPRVGDLERRMLLNEQLDSIQSSLIQANADAIASETAARIAGDQNLQSSLAAEQAAREAGDQANADAIADERDARILADNVLGALLLAEKAARITGDLVLTGLLNAERSARIAGDNNLANQLAAESAARVSGDNQLAALLQAEKNARIAGDNNLANLLAAERVARIAGDFALAGLLALESQARQAADAQQASALAAETTARINGDNALSTLIAQEKAARIAGDNANAAALAAAVFAQSIVNAVVQGQLAAINAKFPVINNQLNSLQSQLNTTNSSLSSLASQVTALNVQMMDLELRQDATEADLVDLRNDIVAAQNQINAQGVQLYKCNAASSTERMMKINGRYYAVMNRVTTETVKVITGSSSTSYTNPKLCLKDDKAKLPGGNGQCPSSWTEVGGDTVTVPAYSTADKTVVTSVKMALDLLTDGSYITTDGGPACSFSISNGGTTATNLIPVQ